MTLAVLIMIVMIIVMMMMVMMMVMMKIMMIYLTFAYLNILTSRASNQSKTEASFQTVMSGSKKSRSKAAGSEKMSIKDR